MVVYILRDITIVGDGPVIGVYDSYAKAEAIARWIIGPDGKEFNGLFTDGDAYLSLNEYDVQ